MHSFGDDRSATSDIISLEVKKKKKDMTAAEYIAFGYRRVSI